MKKDDIQRIKATLESHAALLADISSGKFQGIRRCEIEDMQEDVVSLLDALDAVQSDDNLDVLRLSSLDMDSLLRIMKREAMRNHDGHFAIFSFTGGFKAAFGTPDIYGSRGYQELLGLRSFRTLKKCMSDAVVSGKKFGDFAERA